MLAGSVAFHSQVMKGELSYSSFYSLNQVGWYGNLSPRSDVQSPVVSVHSGAIAHLDSRIEARCAMCRIGSHFDSACLDGIPKMEEP